MSQIQDSVTNFFLSYSEKSPKLSLSKKSYPAIRISGGHLGNIYQKLQKCVSAFTQSFREFILRKQSKNYAKMYAQGY